MTDLNVEIKTIPRMRLAALEHRGPYLEIAKAFERLAALFSQGNLWSHARGMASVYYDDPSEVPEAELRSAAGMVVEESFALPAHMQEIWVGGARCAVLCHKGPYSGLAAAWQAFYHDWLPSSGEAAADIPDFEIYRNNPADTPAEELLTDICVPLREA